MDIGLSVLAGSAGSIVAGIGLLVIGRKPKETREYYASGVWLRRLPEMLELAKGREFSEFELDFIEKRILGQVRLSIADSLAAEKKVRRWGTFTVCTPPVASMVSSVSSALPDQYKTACLIGIAILTGAGTLASALLKFGGYQARWSRSRALAQGLVSELAAFLGSADGSDGQTADYDGVDGVALDDDTAFRLFTTACERRIRLAEAGSINAINSRVVEGSTDKPTAKPGEKSGDARSHHKPKPKPPENDYDGSDY